MNIYKKALVILAVASLAGSVAAPAFARGGNNCHRMEHPRRNEVRGRDNNMDRQINRNRGNLGGNYKSLMGQDKSIKQQTRKDFQSNGGYITKGQQQQLNKEETGLKKEIRQDK